MHEVSLLELLLSRDRLLLQFTDFLLSVKDRSLCLPESGRGITQSHFQVLLLRFSRHGSGFCSPLRSLRLLTGSLPGASTNYFKNRFNYVRALIKKLRKPKGREATMCNH